jgi:hypothetical protein
LIFFTLIAIYLAMRDHMRQFSSRRIGWPDFLADYIITDNVGLTLQWPIDMWPNPKQAPLILFVNRDLADQEHSSAWKVPRKMVCQSYSQLTFLSTIGFPSIFSRSHVA